MVNLVIGCSGLDEVGKQNCEGCARLQGITGRFERVIQPIIPLFLQKILDLS